LKKAGDNMGLSFSFNGERREYINMLRGGKRTVWAPISRQFIELMGAPGGLLSQTKTKMRYEEVPVEIIASDFWELPKVKEDLAKWLVTDEVKELIFDNEPDRTYFAVVDGELDLDEFLEHGTGTITFACPDSYKYTPERTVLLNESTLLNNQGSAEALPVFKFTATQPITFLDIITDQGYMRIGNPLSVDGSGYDKYELVMHETMATLTGWANGTQVDNGAVAGTMASDGSSFYVNDYGTGTSWHGPAKKKSPSQQLDNFRIEALIEQYGIYPNEAGRIEIYLLDAANNVIAKMAMKDTKTAKRLNETEFRLGPADTGEHIILNEYGNREDSWVVFKGMLRIQRVNGRWQAYIALIDENGMHHTTMTRPFEDTEGKYSAPLSQIQVHIASSKQYNPTVQKVNDIKVFKINYASDFDEPYIAYPGDEIIIDHIEEVILLNGEERIDLKDFGASYFTLPKGESNIMIQPSNSLDGEVKIRERYL
jgi:predicted phage tail component-like protein